ncbi:hypothetical protein [Mesorhizobium sp. M0571]|uniref:hypothetical protein n=1 Tax=Mesorhizobium sp. M0571 TaxID=2956960 RepID=UPI00333D3DDB
MKRTFSREELYDLVWSTPIATLAEQFDISDRGLAKTCARYQIPVPGRGYWAKVEAGQPATKTPLWKIENPTLETVHIGAFKPAVNPYVAFAIEAANTTVKKSKAEREARPVREKHSDALSSKEPIVFEPVRRPHDSISSLAAAVKSAKCDQYGEVSVPGVRVHQNSRIRVIAVLHHLVVALEKRNITSGCIETGIKAAIDPDSVRFEISESRNREKHIPTPAELKKHEDHERRREIAQRRGQWLYPESFWPEYDYVYSGKLTLEIQNWADGARKRWGDGKHQTLESMLEAMADGVLFHLAYEKARREEREAEDRRRKHMAHRRELHKKRQEREANRLIFLRQLADCQREAADLRVTIANASNFLPQASLEYLRMIGWAEQRLAHLEAQSRLDTLTSNLREQNLFPEPDDLHDPDGDPPPPRYWGD